MSMVRRSLQVNYLSCALLSVLFVPLVLKTSEMTRTRRPRIVVVTRCTS
jgi:hypothetical protein